MNLKRIKDSIKRDKTIVFHSTPSKDELADIIIKGEFRAGRNGGAMLGPGFYANQHLYQAKKGNYGRYILKAQVYGISKFLFLDKEQYEEVKGEKAPDDFIYQQIKEAGLGDIIGEWKISTALRGASTAETARVLWSMNGKDLRKKFGGFVYTGNFDKESVVCWFPSKQVKPLEWSDDKGETWKPLKELKEYDTGDKKQNLSEGELVRSLQRAKDLVSRYEKYSDEKLAAAINSQLARIKDQPKREVRKDVFLKVLEEQRPEVVSLLEA